MSLVVVIKAPAGIVLAADSRTTVNIRSPGASERAVYFDDARKILRFDRQGKIAVAAYGNAVDAGTRLKIQEGMGRQRKGSGVRSFANKLAPLHPGKGTHFLVAGYNDTSITGQIESKVFAIEYNGSERVVMEQLGGQYGIIRGGETDVVNSLLKCSSLKINVEALGLQGCVDLATTLIETTVSMQQLSVGARGVGGAIDVVTITPVEGVQAIQWFDVVSIARSKGVEIATLRE